MKTSAGEKGGGPPGYGVHSAPLIRGKDRRSSFNVISLAENFTKNKIKPEFAFYKGFSMFSGDKLFLRVKRLAVLADGSGVRAYGGRNEKGLSLRG